MQARREVEESDHTLAERTAAAEQDLGPWNPAAVSGSDSGEWKDAGVKRRARSRSPDSRRGSKKAPHHGGRGGGGRGERRQEQQQGTSLWQRWPGRWPRQQRWPFWQQPPLGFSGVVGGQPAEVVADFGSTNTFMTSRRGAMPEWAASP
ncbi:hypothetical protein WJX75_003829 [Coccomyxa subellipsoidea]|uniref:Uncharacterized protein n=1 Tax=Coccomyxa subellipsoidea TaxID=248742 RepID=A0ABR2YAI5_9CHLO